MRLVIQKVNEASIVINNDIYASINEGVLCYVAFCDGDSDMDLEWSSRKILTLKIFSNHQSLEDIYGDILIVSQFTLFASINKGTKPSWVKAAKPEDAKILYENFIIKFQGTKVKKIQTGIFGSDMRVNSINNGPLTLILDTQNKE